MLYLDYSRKRGRMDPQPVTAAARTSTRSTFLRELNEHRSTRRVPASLMSPRNRPPGRGVSRPTYVGGLGFTSSGTWAGCTTRSTTSHRPDLPPLPPPRADVRADLRLQRELHPAALPRRGRPRQGLAALRRCRATAGRSSPTCARCTPTCGRTRARSCCSWAASSPRSGSGTTNARSTGTCSSAASTPGCSRWSAI